MHLRQDDTEARPDTHTCRYDCYPNKFGEQATADHLISNRVDCQGIEGSAYAVVVFDIGTRHLDC